MARRFMKQLSCLAPAIPAMVQQHGGKTSLDHSAELDQGVRNKSARTLFCRNVAMCQQATHQARRTPRVAVVGDVFVDVMAKVHGLPEWDIDVEADFVKVLPGGSALNGARHLHSLGSEVLFFGAVGDDGFGKMLLERVAGQGFPTDYFRILPDLPSSVCMVLTGPKDRAMVSCYSTTSAFSTAHVEEQAESVLSCEHLHIGGYYNMKRLQSPEFTAFVRRCREHGMSISMNTQYAAAGDWLGRDGHMLKLLPLIDFLFVNGIEADGISTAVVAQCQPDGDAKASGTEQLCSCIPGLTAVVTQGAAGCDVVSAGSSMLRVPTAPLSEVVDATGAGDAFFAGFLYSWLAQRQFSDTHRGRLHAACNMGHAVARVVVGREGACVEPVRPGDVNVGVKSE